MKKVTVDLMLGRRTRSHFRKYGPKSIIVAAQMPVNKAIKGSGYGLRFGKSGLNSGEICDKFNAMSGPIWKENIALPTSFVVSATKSYVMELKTPTVYTLLNVLFQMANKENTRLDLPKLKETLLRILYKIAIIKSQSINRADIESTISQVCGSLYSLDLYNPWRKEKKGFNYKKKGKK